MKMLRIRNVVLLFAVAALCAAAGCLLGQHPARLKTVMTAPDASAARADVSPEQALAKAWKVVQASTSKGTIKYTGRTTENRGVALRFKGPASRFYEQAERDPDGLCYCFHFSDGSAESITVAINIKTGKLYNFSQGTRMEGNADKKIMTVRECRQKAVAWLKAVGEPLAPDMKIYASSPTGGANDMTMHELEWRKALKVKAGTIVAPPKVSVQVNTRTGEIASFSLEDFKWRLPSLEPLMSREQAIKRARKSIREDINNPYGKKYRGGEPGKLTDAFLVVWAEPAYKDKPAQQYLLWEVRFDGKMKEMGRNGPVWSKAHWRMLPIRATPGGPAMITLGGTGPFIQRDDKPADEWR
jgi:hypothetical protein